MPNMFTPGLLGMAQPDQSPDTQKPAADIFTQFGILTPSEKAQQAAQAQMISQLMQQQQQAQQQQLAIQKAQMGGGFNFPVLTALGGTRQPRQQSGMLGGAGGSQDQGEMEPSRILTKAVQEAGGDPVKGALLGGQRMLKLAQQTGNQDLAKIAVNVLTKAKQKALEEQDKMSTVENRDTETAAKQQEMGIKQNQLGNPGTPFQGHAPNGDMVSMAPKYDKNGVFTGYGVITRGPNKQITQSLDDPRTASQKGEEYLKFQDVLTNSRNAIDSMRDITKNLEDGSAQGWAATGVQLLGNAAGTLEQLAPGAKLSSSALTELQNQNGTFKKWFTKTSVNESVWSDLVSSLAKTYNPTGTITEKDIVRAARVVGQNVSDPAAVASILKDAERRTIRGVTNKWQDMGDDARASSQGKFDRFMADYSDQPTKPAPAEDVSSDNPDDDIPAGYPAPKTKVDYDKLPTGTLYYNIHLKKVVPKRG